MPRIKLDMGVFDDDDVISISQTIVKHLIEKEFKPTGLNFRIDVHFYEDEKSDSPNYGETRDDDRYWDYDEER